jgi:hypothetical protein
MESEICAICCEENDDYMQKLQCGHVFHYQCLYLSFKNLKNNDCPYCRSKNNYLPIISGLKNFNSKINEYDIDKIELINKKCEMTLTKGKNKGSQCSKKCKLGYNYCTVHQNQIIKKSN